MTRDEVWFVSDVHLKDGDQDYLDQFLEFLDLAAEGTAALWLVGDIFEFWVGDRQAYTRFYAPLFNRIRDLVRGGVRVRSIHGNRDLLMDRALADAGVEMMPEEVALKMRGVRVHVSHGDNFSVDDRRSPVSRLLRLPAVRWISRHLPPLCGRLVARLYRGVSERKKRRQSRDTGNRFHTIEEGVLSELERGDHDVLICGHIHWLNDGMHEVGGRVRRVITTGAWEEGPNYVVFDGERFAIRRFRRTATRA